MLGSGRFRRFFLMLVPVAALGLGSVFSFLVVGKLDRTSGASPALASGWTVEEARAFDGFPIYWLGENFDGLPLRQITGYEYAGDPTNALYATSENLVAFEYGECEVPPGGDGGCPIPLVVEIDPYCDVPPERISATVKTGPLTTLRGAQAQWFKDGHVRIWTGEVSIGIFGISRQIVKDAVEGLARLNGETPSSPEVDLGPPNAMQCRQRNWHWNNPPPGVPEG